MQQLFSRGSLRRNAKKYSFNSSTNAASRFDIYLQRFSSLAQIGLAIFTIVTIYTTVIPLYQKSLLEESIAKKETELKKLTIALENAYSKVRKNAIKDFVLVASAECSGLLNKKIDNINASKNNQKEPSFGDMIFEITVSSCIVEISRNSKALNELQAGDLDIFNEQISRIQKDLLTLKKEAWTKYKNVAEIPLNKLPQIDQNSPSYRTLQTISTLISPESFKKYQTKIIIEEEELRIASEYSRAVREKILSLLSINWSKPNIPLTSD